MTTSSASERFRCSCFGSSFHEVREGLDVEAAKSLAGEERAKAEALILEALPETVVPVLSANQSGVSTGYDRMEAAVPIAGPRKFVRVSGVED